MPGNLLEKKSLPRETLRQMADAQRLYAILDACDAPIVLDKIRELGDEKVVSLYRGMAEEDYWSFAPYLAVVDSDLLDWIVENLWEEPWGIFILTDNNLAGLRTHLRHFLIVDDPQREEMYFRFYDPRVLRKFLPTCITKELTEFYGTIEAFLIADEEDPEAVVGIARIPGARSPTPTAYRIGQRFSIREEQMAVFGPEANKAFEARLIVYLREHHADLVRDFSDDLLLPMVRTGIARARGYGMTWESNLTAYVAMMFEIAPNFDRHPRTNIILSSRQIPPETKLDVLVDRTSEQVWQEVALNYDSDAWFDLEPENA